MNYYIEWVPSSLYRTGNMVPIYVIPDILRRSDPGYASVYMFKEEDAVKIRSTGSSRGLTNLSVASCSVILDIDNPGDIDQVIDTLQSHNFGFEVWDSGRGFHVVIPHKLIEDVNLPYSHKVWVERLQLPVDYSLYQHSRILRLPGTVNAKTGRPKQLVKIYEGDMANIDIITPPTFNLKPETFGLKTIEVVLNQLQRLATNEPAQGNRHTRIWSAACSMAEADLSFDTALELLQEINTVWKNPKPTEEVVKAVTQAYKQTGKYEQE